MDKENSRTVSGEVAVKEKTIIETNGLTKKYNDFIAVDHVTFNVFEGEIFGFLGPNGAGKTTMQRLIIGLLSDYNGHIEILGKERNEWNNDFYNKIGVAFDFPNLYLKLTAYENLKLILTYYDNDNVNIDKLLDEVNLLKDKNEKVENFSKGMKMRLNFIRSIMHDPEVIFFDEPTSGLDPVNAKIIKEKILKLKQDGKTIFLTTHNMTVAEQLCDKIAFINEGNISVIDSPKNLMIKHGNSNIDIFYIKNNKEFKFSIPSSKVKGNKELIEIINNYEIRTIHSNEATLEDIFIKFTGRELI